MSIAVSGCGPSAPAGPTDADVALWAGTESWGLDDYELPQLRMSWVRTCITEVPPNCIAACDLRQVLPPMDSGTVPERYRLHTHRIVRKEATESDLAIACSELAPRWESVWRSPWTGPVASTWYVTTDARTGSELSAQRGSPMRRRMLPASNR